MRYLLCALVMSILSACSSTPATVHALRLEPGQDVKEALLSFTESQSLQAAAVVSAVGSLSEAVLRFADGNEANSRRGPFEIVSLSGTLSPDGAHLHVSVSDHEGVTTGGHLMPGCIVHTTLELVLLEPSDLRFARVDDPQTGYRELQVLPMSRP